LATNRNRTIDQEVGYEQFPELGGPLRGCHRRDAAIGSRAGRMDAALHNFYNWFSIVAILVAAGLLVMAVLNQSEPLTAVFASSIAGKVCQACGAVSEVEARFCKTCGHDLSAS
jgi:ribosomal protein L40E